MQPNDITRIAAGLHVALVAAAIYYALRINNHAELSEISIKEMSVMSGMVLLPILSAWIGLRLAHTPPARWLMAIGQTLALVLFAATFVMVLNSVEPMAPLLFVLVSLWIAVGLAVLLLLVWLTGRSRK